MQRSALVIGIVAAVSGWAAARADVTPPGPVQVPASVAGPAAPPVVVQAPVVAPMVPPIVFPTLPLGAAATLRPTPVPTLPPTSAPTPPPAPGPVPPRSLVLSVAPESAEAILGQPVTDPKGKDIGRLVDVLVNAAGQPQAAVIDFGGFMGVGNRKIAVHWSVIHFNPGDPNHKVTLDMTPNQIKAAPEFLNSNKAAPVVTPANIAKTSP